MTSTTQLTLADCKQGDIIRFTKLSGLGGDYKVCECLMSNSIPKVWLRPVFYCEGWWLTDGTRPNRMLVPVVRRCWMNESVTR